ncbi:probable glycosyl transferase [Oceanicola granulosus HTCC2516]|uniref:Probable glycosyl transferase n=2 Tax=Oceanicola granulosus TaxID=252302 RepID=Q2CHA0_OCEGH|nr:probable glycosyl transferase [Oceanicola granulosus HTCC2516]
MDGIRVIRVWSYVTRNEGFAKRILDHTSYMMAATLASLFIRRVDVIIGTSPQFFTACAAWAVSALKRRPWIFELRDIWPESIRAVGAMRQSRVLDTLEKVELFLYRKATAIISVTQAFKQNLVERGIDAAKIHVVTNGVDASRFQPLPKDAALQQELGLEGKFVAGYIGTHGMAHGLGTLLDAAARLKAVPNGDVFRIILLGDGATRAALQARATAEGLDNVLFLDSVPKEEVPRYWSLLDASIVHLIRRKLFTTVIPSKIFECMAMAIPILHGVEGESAEIVQTNGVGILFEPENGAALAAILQQLHNDPDLRSRLAASGPPAAHRYDRRRLASDMLRIVEKCLPGASTRKPLNPERLSDDAAK